MSKVDPFHTNSTEYAPTHRNVYHDQGTCPDGKKIKDAHRVKGTGSKDRCKECIKIG